MRKNTLGFGFIEMILTLVVVGFLIFAGWFIFSRNTAYSFAELGISMNIKPGWEVSEETTVSAEYEQQVWSIKNPDNEALIQLSGTTMPVGFEGLCKTRSDYTRAEIIDIAPTKNPDFLYLHYIQDYIELKDAASVIIRADQSNFYSSDDIKTPIKNGELTTGEYIFCGADPMPGFDLLLADGFITSISVVVDEDEVGGDWSPDIDMQGYQELKDMLTSLK